MWIEHTMPPERDDEPAPEPTIIYCYPVTGYEDYAVRFVHSMAHHAPGIAHRVVVACNGGKATGAVRALFSPLRAEFYEHDNTGWDIGAYCAIAKLLPADTWVCPMGATAHVGRGGWLRRLAAVTAEHGPGLYGTLATQEVRPHIRTTGFLCQAGLLAAYPEPVVTKGDRYAFEHGERSLTARATKGKLPVLCVTWGGEYGWRQWGEIRNGYRNGDQSQCLTYDNRTDSWSR